MTLSVFGTEYRAVVFTRKFIQYLRCSFRRPGATRLQFVERGNDKKRQQDYGFHPPDCGVGGMASTTSTMVLICATSVTTSVELRENPLDTPVRFAPGCSLSQAVRYRLAKHRHVTTRLIGAVGTESKIGSLFEEASMVYAMTGEIPE